MTFLSLLIHLKVLITLKKAQEHLNSGVNSSASEHLAVHIICNMKVKVTWNMAKYGDAYSEFVLCN